MIKEEIKSKLRDWMTATIQLDKVANTKRTSADISYAWRRVFGIRMNEKWVEKALYGKRNLDNC
jgi:hypothetical protein